MNRLHTFIAAATLLLVMFGAEGALAERAALVTEVVGVAERVDAGSAVRLEVGDWLSEGTEVRTGGRSRLTLRVPGGSYLRLDSETRMRLGNLGSPSGPVRGAFAVRSGLAAVVVPALRSEQSFIVDTPTSSAAVRGTVFYVGVDPERELEWVCGMAGEVEVSIAARPESVEVTPNWGVWFDSAGEVVALRELTAEEREHYVELSGPDAVQGGLDAELIEELMGEPGAKPEEDDYGFL